MSPFGHARCKDAPHSFALKRVSSQLLANSILSFPPGFNSSTSGSNPKPHDRFPRILSPKTLSLNELLIAPRGWELDPGPVFGVHETIPDPGISRTTCQNSDPIRSHIKEFRTSPGDEGLVDLIRYGVEDAQDQSRGHGPGRDSAPAPGSIHDPPQDQESHGHVLEAVHDLVEATGHWQVHFLLVRHHGDQPQVGQQGRGEDEEEPQPSILLCQSLFPHSPQVERCRDRITRAHPASPEQRRAWSDPWYGPRRLQT